MAKKKSESTQHIAVVNNTSLSFFEKYINNPSPTGFEWKGQQLWLDYLKPYI
ncbi:MAG: ysdC, partial [Mucilaginibacter sp.]|nr:ysdC [Mucilaginibacter sp.]